MSTVQQLLTLVDSLYPNAETIETKLIFMNMAQNELSPYFGLIVEDSSNVTVQDVDILTIPTANFNDVSQIISLAIGNIVLYDNYKEYDIGDIVWYKYNTYKADAHSVMNLPTSTFYWTKLPINRYDYTQYKLSQAEFNPQQSNSYFQIINSLGEKKIAVYPTPLLSDYPVIIRYKKNLAKLTSFDIYAVPEFDDRYHTLLAFYACKMICSVGSSPDSYQADFFTRMYDDLESKLWKVKKETDEIIRRKPRDNPQWHKGRSYQAGFQAVLPPS